MFTVRDERGGVNPFRRHGFAVQATIRLGDVVAQIADRAIGGFFKRTRQPKAARTAKPAHCGVRIGTERFGGFGSLQLGGERAIDHADAIDAPLVEVYREQVRRTIDILGVAHLVYWLVEAGIVEHVAHLVGERFGDSILDEYVSMWRHVYVHRKCAGDVRCLRRGAQ
jgi:hypothetical protein